MLLSNDSQKRRRPPEMRVITPARPRTAPMTWRRLMRSPMRAAASAPVIRGPNPLISVAFTAVVCCSPRYSVGVNTTTPLVAIPTRSQRSSRSLRSSRGRRSIMAARIDEAIRKRDAARVMGPMSLRSQRPRVIFEAHVRVARLTSPIPRSRLTGSAGLASACIRMKP